MNNCSCVRAILPIQLSWGKALGLSLGAKPPNAMFLVGELAVLVPGFERNALASEYIEFTGSNL
eukprot:8713803-Heterocapsa_arctica.AAC.1